MQRVESPWPELSRAEAQAYLDTFVAETPQRRAALRDLVRRGGEFDASELDESPESLTPLWAWARRRFAYHPEYDWTALRPRRLGAEDLPPLTELPSWVGGDIRDSARFTPDTLWLIDMVTRELAVVLQRMNPQAEWRVGHRRRPGYVDQNKPVLAWGDDDLNPLRKVQVLVAKEIEGIARDDDLLYEVAVRAAGQLD